MLMNIDLYHARRSNGSMGVSVTQRPAHDDRSSFVTGRPPVVTRRPRLCRSPGRSDQLGLVLGETASFGSRQRHAPQAQEGPQAQNTRLNFLLDSQR
jgi:hypothetical protein